jgi:TonB family protein
VRVEWSDNWEADFAAWRRRRFLALLSASFALHLAVMAVLVLVPRASQPALPRVISIDLVSLPAPPAAAKPKPTRLPKPTPEPVVPKKILLPKKAPALREKPKPRKVKPLMRRPRPKEMEYDDALAQLRSQLGETEPAPREIEPPAPPEAEAEPSAATGTLVSKELKAWEVATKRHVKSGYVTPPEFLGRSLETWLRVMLSASGEVIGTPEIARSSGDPYWDDNAVRTVISASPLPAPPEAGSWTFTFPSQER